MFKQALGVLCLVLIAAVFINAQDSTGMKGMHSKMDKMMMQGKDNMSGMKDEFVTKAASGGMMEVQLGNLAQQKAFAQEVKDFGKMMVADHTKANNQLKTIAQKNNLKVPASLLKEHQEKVDKLSKLSGKEFDKAYVDLMVKDHQEDVKEFEEASKNEKNSDVKTFAGNTLPTLRMHLEHIQKIQKNVK